MNIRRKLKCRIIPNPTRILNFKNDTLRIDSRKVKLIGISRGSHCIHFNLCRIVIRDCLTVKTGFKRVQVFGITRLNNPLFNNLDHAVIIRLLNLAANGRAIRIKKLMRSKPEAM